MPFLYIDNKIFPANEISKILFFFLTKLFSLYFKSSLLRLSAFDLIKKFIEFNNKFAFVFDYV